MRTRLAYLGAWLLGTVVAIAVTTAAVGLVRDEVTDGPTVSTIALPEPSTTTTVTTTSEAPSTTSSTAPPSSSSSTTSEPPITSTSTTTTTRAPTTSTTSTTSTTEPSTTTTTTGSAIVRTYTLIGGAVTISAADPAVTLVAATPSAGFTVDVGDTGPQRVEVEFESLDHESEFTARWDDGELVIEIDESDDGQ